jgi:hypothetical protein
MSNENKKKKEKEKVNKYKYFMVKLNVHNSKIKFTLERVCAHVNVLIRIMGLSLYTEEEAKKRKKKEKNRKKKKKKRKRRKGGKKTRRAIIESLVHCARWKIKSPLRRISIILQTKGSRTDCKHVSKCRGALERSEKNQ